MSEQNVEKVTRRMVAEAIDWLGGHGDDGIEFDTADWSRAEEDGTVVVEGYYQGDHYIRAVISIVDFHVEEPMPEWGEEDDDE